MATKTMMGLLFQEPSQTDLDCLENLPKGALVCINGESILVWNPATETIREDYVLPDGEPVAYVWTYKSADPNINAL